MGEWVKINDRYPEKPGKYLCKLKIGSASTEIIERYVLFTTTMIRQKRDAVGDWTRVLEWKDSVPL